MTSSNAIRRAVRHALLCSAVAASVGVPTSAMAAETPSALDTVVVTGTRITAPGVESSSPIFSVTAEEIQLQQQPEIEKILRVLPITMPSDGQNANNGTAGAATINLRGLGSQRNLILINGKRATPYNFNGLVDTSIIPTALVERIDIVTGGASAVYGSDAISGAINFILKNNFEGVELNGDFSQTGARDGNIRTASATLGANVADGQGNVVLGLNWSDREGVQLGARPLGRLGIETATGAGYADFLAGRGPQLASGTCAGENAVLTGGSTTTLPTRVSIVGGPGLGQFRTDKTLGANCSVFNFNPYNYYQTPQERFGATALGHFEVNEYADVYARAAYSSTRVRQQVAPSGVFGTPFWTPLSNPLISAAARTTILATANTGRIAGTVTTTGAGANWRDINANGVVDAADELNISYRRRTVEFGERSTTYDNNAFQMLAGVTGKLFGEWSYDVSVQHGESDRTNTSAGYTNIANMANAVNSINGTTCRTGGSACVPIDLFGGTITPAMAAYSAASALEQQSYEQSIIALSANGPIEIAKLPWADSPLLVSVGAEYREENAETVPDECLKLAPASCLGGAGGNTLPIAGGFDVTEYFGEAILPIVRDITGLQLLDLEVGYRTSDYNLTGTENTYKYGFSWKPLDDLRVRAMRQRAIRAPNVGELAAPQTSGLDNATQDPCSIANAANINATLRARCIATGMTNAQVGTVQDIVSGQINGFFGTDLSDLPAPELADTTTIGVVWTPSFGGMIKNALFSIDYYDIDIQDVIGEFGAQEVLDACYVAGITSECAKIRRVGGDLVLPGSGIQLFTTNLKFLQAEGIEFGFALGFDIGSFGSLTVAGNVNKYLTQESQSSDFVDIVDCKGFFGTNCGGPLPDVRWVQRTTWTMGDYSVSALWRHIGSAESEVPVFAAFQEIDSFDYLDLYASWQAFEQLSVSFGVTNVFEKEPPVVGNEAADTRSNSGNTFPSGYDTLGRVFTLGVRAKF